MTTTRLADFTEILAKGRNDLIGKFFEISDITESSQTLPVKILDAPSAGIKNSVLVFVFHGRVNQATMTIPAFDGRFMFQDSDRVRTTVISISDPSLKMSPALEVAFYAGNGKGDTPNQIAKLIDATVLALSPSRVIFVGGSSGGHPALIHSARIAGSIAVVCNPIMQVSTYFQPTVTQYRNDCWDGCTVDELRAAIVDDAGSVYEENCRNTVIYLQNATDHHVKLQLASFLGKLRNFENLLLLCEYIPGTIGHAYDSKIWARWIRAAVEAKSTNRLDIAEKQHQLSPQPTAASGRKDPPATEAHDIELADKLVQYIKEKARE